MQTVNDKPDIKLMSLGFLVAFFSAGVGIGGGTLLVSILTAMFAYDFKNAASSSLATIIPISLVGALSHFMMLPEISDPSCYYLFIPFCIIGSMIGGRIVQKRRNSLLKLGFSFFLLIIGMKMLTIIDFPGLFYAGAQEFLIPYRIPMIMLVGIATGVTSVLLGLGCGLIIVPFFVIVIQLDMRQAITLSLTTMFFLTLSGTLIHRKLKNLPRIPVKNLIVPAFFGAVSGVMISSHLPTLVLKKVFGAALFLIACKFIITELLLLYGELNSIQKAEKGALSK